MSKNKPIIKNLFVGLCVIAIFLSVFLVFYTSVQPKLDLLWHGQPGTGEITYIAESKYSVKIIDPAGITGGFQQSTPGRYKGSDATRGVYAVGDQAPVLYKDNGAIGELGTRQQIKNEFISNVAIYGGLFLLLILFGLAALTQKLKKRKS